jgi:hypothetical protein
MAYKALATTGICVLLGLVGCSKDDGRIPVYPVTGKVIVNGAPAERAQVVFYPIADELRKPGMPIPSAATDANGVFRLRSYDPGDGAPVGKFNVTVFWAGPARSGADEESESYVPNDRLGGRYADPKKSGLTATVEEGGGELPPFELK